MSKKEKKIYDVEKIRKNLHSLAEKKPERATSTACGIVAELENEIRALVKAGYTVLEISEALNNDVADISVGTFQNYISKMKITIDKMGTKNKKNKTKKSNNKEPKKIEGCAEAQAAAQAFFDIAEEVKGRSAEDAAQILEEKAKEMAENKTDSHADSDQKAVEKPAKQPAVGVETPTLSVADGGIEVYPDEI